MHKKHSSISRALYPMLQRITVADAILLLALVAGNIVLYTLSATPGNEAGVIAEVATTANDTRQSYPLHTDRRIEVAGRLGTSVLEIKQNRVRFVTAPCPRRYCIQAGWLHQAQQWAACLENGISLYVRGTTHPAYDSINY